MFVGLCMQALQAQGMMWIPANVTVAYFLGNLVLNSVFIQLWGFTGVAFAQSASRSLMLLMLLGKSTVVYCMRPL
jgi:O-antigen/teichoic acid export membrane protein